MLFDYGDARRKTSDGDAALELVAVRNGQHVFTSVIESYLQRVDYAPDGYATRIRLPAYRDAEVVADPERSFGSPIFAHGGARVSDVLQRFWAGDTLEELVADYRVPAEQLEDVLRVASRRAA